MSELTWSLRQENVEEIETLSPSDYDRQAQLYMLLASRLASHTFWELREEPADGLGEDTLTDD